MAVSIGVEPQRVLEVLDGFQGMDRRLMLKGRFGGISVIDDYAHHPDEDQGQSPGHPRAVSAPSGSGASSRPISTAGRSRSWTSSPRSFADADKVLIPEIFFARDTEASRNAVNAKILAEQDSRAGDRCRSMSPVSARSAIVWSRMFTPATSSSRWAPAMCGRWRMSIFSGFEEIVEQDHPLAPHTWYRLGGPADYFIRPRNVKELKEIVRRCNENHVPMYVLGFGSNLLVSDEGVRGAVIKLQGEEFGRTQFEGPKVTAWAGAELSKLVLDCVEKGLSGVEGLTGIPGLDRRGRPDERRRPASATSARRSRP